MGCWPVSGYQISVGMAMTWPESAAIWSLIGLGLYIWCAFVELVVSRLKDKNRYRRKR